MHVSASVGRIPFFLSLQDFRTHVALQPTATDQYDSNAPSSLPPSLPASQLFFLPAFATKGREEGKGSFLPLLLSLSHPPSLTACLGESPAATSLLSAHCSSVCRKGGACPQEGKHGFNVGGKKVTLRNLIVLKLFSTVLCVN